MSITLTPIQSGTLCHGYSWEVADQAKLAEQIALVALGHSWNVGKILEGAAIAPCVTRETARAAAIKMLTKAGDDPSHRDGWMFQVMSWIAAKSADKDALVRSPHMILAHKGFDGLQLDLDLTRKEVIAIVIFEDKATVNSRKVVREDVWESFRAIERGENDNVLVSEMAALLGTAKLNIDVEAAIQNVIWEKIRHYRLSITVDSTFCPTTGLEKLFDGYDTVVSGDAKRRRSEILLVNNLRLWMDTLASQAIEAAKHV